MSKVIALDEKDHLILAELRGDSRQSIRDIAKKTQIRPSTVHQRITVLRKYGIIEKFTVKLNSKSIGEDFTVFMLFNSEQNVEDKFIKNDHVKELCGITGEYDLIMKMKFRDVAEFNDFILEFRKNKNIEKTLTMVVTATIKEEI